MTRVKICGLTRLEDAQAAAQGGADFLGFVFAPGRRRIAPEEAREIAGHVRRHSNVTVVGVFVNAGAAEMNRIARTVGLDYLQLSGDEPDDLPLALERPAVRVIHVRNGAEKEHLERRLERAREGIVLFDTGSPGSFGGTGRTFDWSLLPAADRRFMVAGGLHTGNVDEVIGAVRPWGVDVSSGVETDGQKDPNRIHAFLQRVRAADRDSVPTR